MTEFTDKQIKIMADIEATFDEIEHKVDAAKYWADFAQGKPPKVDKHQSHGIVHGSEFIMSRASHKAKRDLLDKRYESENLTRSIDDDSDVKITINVPD